MEFQEIPPEIVLEIFSFIDLNLNSLTVLENVCTIWREVCEVYKAGKPNNFTVTVIGPSGGGKTSMMARLLSQEGYIKKWVLKNHLESKMNKDINNLKQGGKSKTLEQLLFYLEHGSFFDKTLDEIKKKKTLHVRRIGFGTKRDYSYSFIDTPGSLVKNMIRGMSLGDLCILVISADSEEFQHAIENKEFSDALIGIKSLGKKLLIAVNKMDKVQYSQKTFEILSNKLETLTKKYQLKCEIIPISGLECDNLVDSHISTNLYWYKGPNLLSMIDSYSNSHRINSIDECFKLLQSKTLPEYEKAKKPLRFVVNKVYKTYGTIVSGMIFSGIISEGDHITIEPKGVSTTISQIYRNNIRVESAQAEDYVSISLGYHEIERGDVIGPKIGYSPIEVESLIANVLNIRPKTKIKNGFEPLLFVHSTFVPCKVEITGMVDKKSLKVKQVELDSDTIIKYNELAEMKITPLKPLSMDLFSEWKSLGRFILRDGSSRHVAVGRVHSIKQKSKNIQFVHPSYIKVQKKPKKEIIKDRSKETLVEDGIWKSFIFDDEAWNQ
eukprot:gene5494-9311_t